jgi:hypothetical protein
MQPHGARPVTSTLTFLLGVQPRCGTNFLSRLLLKHPDVARRVPIWEDYLLSRMGPVAEFVTGTTDRWHHDFQAGGDEARALAEAIGDGITRFMAAGSRTTHLLTKTPSTENIALAPLFFPHSPVILLVRDGRSVAESARRTFGTDITATAREWARSARQILGFLGHGAAPPGGNPRILIRYEDLFTDPAAQLDRIFDLLGLPATRYPYAEIESLPLYGSSVERGGAPEVHWNPVPRPAGFDPLNRHHDWDDATLTEFDRIAGDMLVAFGYPAGRGSADGSGAPPGGGAPLP